MKRISNDYIMLTWCGWEAKTLNYYLFDNTGIIYYMDIYFLFLQKKINFLGSQVGASNSLNIPASSSPTYYHKILLKNDGKVVLIYKISGLGVMIKTLSVSGSTLTQVCEQTVALA